MTSKRFIFLMPRVDIEFAILVSLFERTGLPCRCNCIESDHTLFRRRLTIDSFAMRLNFDLFHQILLRLMMKITFLNILDILSSF